jgi:type II secretory pathway pseudopilin PulG
MRRQRGFTLVESIIVVGMLFLAAGAIISMQRNIFSGQSVNTGMQVGVQLMQECAEQILATRRSSSSGAGYAAVTAGSNGTGTCGALGNYGGYGTPTVTVDPDTSAACPTILGVQATCELVTITVSKTGFTTDTGLTPLILLLVSY